MNAKRGYCDQIPLDHAIGVNQEPIEISDDEDYDGNHQRSKHLLNQRKRQRQTESTIKEIESRAEARETTGIKEAEERFKAEALHTSMFPTLGLTFNQTKSPLNEQFSLQLRKRRRHVLFAKLSQRNLDCVLFHQ